MAANKNNVTKRSDVNRPLTYVEGDTNFEELKNVITDQQSFESQQNTRNSTYETDISDLQIDTNTNTNDITSLRTDVDTATIFFEGKDEGSEVYARVGDGQWDGVPLRMGGHYLWVYQGKLRIKLGAPTSGTDGELVGA